jgi:fucose permease
VSHMSTPLIMGFLADRYGIVEAFYASGILALICAVAIGFMRPWAFRRP